MMGRLGALVGAVLGASIVVPVSAGAAIPIHPVSAAPYTVPAACASKGLDGEVSLAVDPGSGRMVAAWMQDVEGLGNSALSTLAVVSAASNNGVDWTPATAPPGVMLCDLPPGPNDAAFDPSVSVDAGGRWYVGRLGEVVVPGLGLPPPGGIYVTSSASGTNWRWPTAPMLDSYQDDYDTVVADPKVAGRAYATWTNYPVGVGSPKYDRTLFAKTSNGGATFSRPITVHRARAGYLDVIPRLVRLDDGTLLIVYAEIPASTIDAGDGPFALYATRSADHGKTWSQPVRVRSDSYANVVDPETHTLYEFACCVFSLSAGPGRSAYLAWNTNPSLQEGHVKVISTSDGGRSWTTTADLARPAQAFEATVAATPRTIALTFYDFSGAQPPDQDRPTTLWLARSGDGGVTWRIRRLAGPFDLASETPPGDAAYLGDFQSLVPVDGGFEAAFTLAKPLARNGPSDVFAAFIPECACPVSTGLRAR